MPKVLEKQGFTFYFYASDCKERCHIHVKKGEGEGKIWLRPEIEVSYLKDFKTQEIKRIFKIVKDQHSYLKNQWDAYCNNR